MRSSVEGSSRVRKNLFQRELDVHKPIKLPALFRRRPTNTEASRRERLLKFGRVYEATIMDVSVDKDDVVELIFYRYDINSVDYESSQTLDDEQRARAHVYIPGARVTLRYDPRQPTNSVVV